MERKGRRSKLRLELDIIRATEELIKEVGFNNITITDLIQRAEIEPNVFYRRYHNIDELLDRISQYVQIYNDYWFVNKIEYRKKGSPEDNLKKYLIELTKSLYKNDLMQQTLLWELSSSCNSVKNIAHNREIYSQPILDYFTAAFKDCETDFKAATALMIGGIYYLVLHRNVSTFCNIDFNSKEGRKALIKVIENIVDKIYEENKVVSIAQKLLDRDVDINIIAESTGLSIKAISKLKFA